ncbi:hypothetical protein M419DRAFT_9968 [Trichoderma reesei RUT C-30]|uniref:Uncharacterized protein n=1 Tax=Hypocrea jecorina (strain ATCC 56765 / BCRC 32924 / NRRL 11460 / Rut C-30) TaxID=1344414 RepID=A0A024S832_HYPJR|nr:hypothetical protein M419DRAFT_9968 [Trichoderma reesei RUT C-30]
MNPPPKTKDAAACGIAGSAASDLRRLHSGMEARSRPPIAMVSDSRVGLLQCGKI